MYDSLFLSDVEQGTEFHLVTGQSVKNIYELVGALKSLSQENFSYHCNDEKDDFGTWITHSLHNSMIGNILSRVKDQKKYVRIIEKAIHHKEIESQARLHVVKVSRLWIENNNKKLSEMHHMLKEYEKRFLEKQKDIDDMIANSVNRYVEGFLSTQKAMLKQEIENTRSSNKQFETEYEQKLKDMQDGFEKMIDEYATNAVSKIAEGIVNKHKQEFIDIIWNEKTEARKEVQTAVQKELSGIVDKQKELIQNELAMTFQKQKDMEKALEESLKEKEEELIKKISEHSEKELLDKISKQRELLDNELSKTIKSNTYFIEKFENEIRDKEKRLTETINSAVERELMKSISKHQKELDKALAKAVDSLKITQKECDSKLLDRHPELINDASEKIRENVIKYFTEQRELISKEIKKQLDSHTQSAVIQHKELLGKEVSNAVASTQQITKDVEDKLQNKTLEIAALAEELVSKALDKKLDKTLDKHKSNISSESDKVIDFISQKQKEHEEHLSLKEEELKKIVEDAVVEAVSQQVGALIEEHKQNLDETLEEHEKSLDEELEKVHSLNKDMENRYYKAVEEKGEKIIDKVGKKTDTQLQNVIDKKTAILEKELVKIKNLMDSLFKQKTELLVEKNKILADIKQAADSKISSKISEIEKKTAKYKLEIESLEKETATYRNRIKSLEDELKGNNIKIKALENKITAFTVHKHKEPSIKKKIAVRPKTSKIPKLEKPKITQLQKNIVEKKPKVNNEQKIYDLINQSEDALERNDYDKVRALYHELAFLFNNGEYNPKDKKDLYGLIKDLYNKIYDYAEKQKETGDMIEVNEYKN